MKTLEFVETKLNGFSIIGSLVYGLFCAFFSTPEVVAVIGYIAYFLAAALFYFAMYVLYSEHKELISRLWKKKIRSGGIFIVGLMTFFCSLTFIYMIVNHVPYFVAGDMMATDVSHFLYYIPFLP